MSGPTTLSLRDMQPADLSLIRAWLGQPHVARWYLTDGSIEGELDELRRAIAGEEPTQALIVIEDDRAIGWCQWYRCADYPEHATAVEAEPDDVGIDYAIGEPERVGQGVGTDLIAALVAHVRRDLPRAGVIADPEAANLGSRRILEKNGFVLTGERPLASEPTDAPMAIYRLQPPSA